jgi:hypothetical protein
VVNLVALQTGRWDSAGVTQQRCQHAPHLLLLLL